MNAEPLGTAGPRSGEWTIRAAAGPDDWDGSSRVAAEVGGALVWMATSDAVLDDVPEAWATAYCIPASRWGAGLDVDRPVDPAWRAGAAANVELAASWWGGDPVLHLRAPAGPKRRWPGRPPRGSGVPAAGRGLCFTAGVDSFFSLLCGTHVPTHLLYVAGFDVALDDLDRTRDTSSAVRDVASHLGLDAVVVRTNLRSEHRFASTSWEHTHGAALAAVGHVVHRTIGTLVIPPSYAGSRLVPWGSRPDLDPRWSVPGRLHIEHGDAAARRVDRVLAIAAHPLVHRHLRVCWQHVEGRVNCGRCEKCVRTMVMLAVADQLQHCETFPDRAALPAAIDGLEPLGPGQAPMWRDLVARPLDAPVRASLDALLGRSPTS